MPFSNTDDFFNEIQLNHQLANESLNKSNLQERRNSAKKSQQDIDSMVD
jgi:hypothetical protein